MYCFGVTSFGFSAIPLIECQLYVVGQSVLQSAKAHNSFSAFLLQICAVYFALLSSDLGWSSVLKRHLSPETFLVKDVFTKLYFFTPVSIFKKYTFWFKNWFHKFWNTICMILKDLKDLKRLFRSARTSWNTFVSPSVSLRQKSKSHLKPYKSPTCRTLTGWLESLLPGL